MVTNTDPSDDATLLRPPPQPTAPARRATAPPGPSLPQPTRRDNSNPPRTLIRPVRAQVPGRHHLRRVSILRAAGSDPGEGRAKPPPAPRCRTQTTAARAATAALATRAPTYGHPARPPCHRRNAWSPPTEGKEASSPSYHHSPPRHGQKESRTERCALGDIQTSQGKAPRGHPHTTGRRH